MEHEDYLKKRIREITSYNITIDDFKKILNELNGVEKLVISLELGINNREPKSVEEIAKIFRADESLIQQKEEKAHQKIKTLVSDMRK